MRLQMKRTATNAARGLLLAAGLLLAVQTQAQTPDYWSTSGSRIVDAQGNTVHITGANWFGFETSNMMPHGLWSVNYRSFLDKVKSMGITVIRLPYSDDIMSNAPVQSLNDYVNPELKGVTTLQLMDAIVAYCKQLGIRIILDRHRPTGAGQSALWYIGTVPESRWIANMQALAARYKGNDTVVGFDLHNEPHAEGTEPNSTGACWGCGDVNRDWRLAAERGGNAVLQANPDLLILVEGVSCPSGGNANVWDNIPDEQCGWWGGNITRARQYPVRLSNPRKLVYSPHDYGMSVYGQQSWFLDPAFPATLEPYWDNMWGYIAKEGIAPILIGEFGSTLQDPKDRIWLPKLLDYANRNGMSWTYWCLNPNSGDTKGLFLDDWTTIDTVRYDVIKPFLTPLKGGGGPGPTYYSLVVTKAGTGSGTVAGGTINCGTTCTASLASGTSVTLTATPATGSTFDGWSGACTGTGACTVSMTAARTVTATFSTSGGGTTYTLSVTKAGTGSGTVAGGTINCGTACSASFASGTTVTLTATPATGSLFAGWSGACTGTGACTVAMTAARTVTATFNLSAGGTTYALTVNKAGTGSGTVAGGTINCGTACTASFASGTSVTLTATPATGSTFAGWSGACTGTAATCTVSMTAARTVTATFDTSGGGTAPCANALTFTSNTGNFNTTGAVCYRTSQRVNGWGCSNFAGRTVSVNGGTATASCGAGPFPLAQSGGYTYFSVSAGSYPWASIYIW